MSMEEILLSMLLIDTFTWRGCCFLDLFADIDELSRRAIVVEMNGRYRELSCEGVTVLHAVGVNFPISGVLHFVGHEDPRTGGRRVNLFR